MTAVPSGTWRMLTARTQSEKLPKGLDAAWTLGAGLINRLAPRRRALMKHAAEVVALHPRYADMSDAALRAAAIDLREKFLRARQTRTDLINAFAIVREVAFRTIGERPYLVQVAGAIAIESGCIAEMATGEGKTLTATMPAVIAGWRGRGCHIITTNDYLAARDAEWMRPLYQYCGLSAGHIEQNMTPSERRLAYHADITYCTNKEVAADFLRDRLTMGHRRGLTPTLLDVLVKGKTACDDRFLQRGLHHAIIDEADSVLIDEAVTPLIISGWAPNSEQVDAYVQAAALASELTPSTHYVIEERYREINLTPSGRTLIDNHAESLGGLWAGRRRREELIQQALVARHFHLRDKQYVVQNNKVMIVDEFTGRLMPDREWRDGLHQAVEAKEGLKVNPPKDTFARVSFQRFFRLYSRLSGMTGTAAEAVGEFWQIYRLGVVVIPTNRPIARKQLPDMVFATEKAKFAAIVKQIRHYHQIGRPVLVGTRSVHASETLSDLLTQAHLDHQVLNAVKHAEEAQIIAGAGQPGRITVATNMAGRGTDIKLARGVSEKGGLHVIASERHEARRIDRQLFGRSGRQGDPGTVQAIVSLEDELPRRYWPLATALLHKRYRKTNGEISSGPTRALFGIAQARAQRFALAQRKGVLRSDDWLDEYLGFAGSE